MDLINLIHKELPQIQCGRCDTPGCMQYAQAIVDGESHDRCVPGGKKTLDKLNTILDKHIHEVDQVYGPTINNQKVSIVEDECIGCKKCINVCPVDAIVGASNMMHSIIDDICTGCELCIEPCPVDCIEIIEISNKSAKEPRKKSQEFFNIKESLINDKKRSKLKNFSNENISISDSINTKIKNRNVNKSSYLEEMQLDITKKDLTELHKFDESSLDNFIKDKS
ncbi:MAG: RnfABCDGE type electron transport complex subunit B [Gammaproteobacteria bacterium]